MTADIALRGFIERIEFGNGFLFVSGWVSTEDNRALEEDLLLRIEGVPELVITSLLHRPDLESANIAGGQAGFAHAMRTGLRFREPPQIYASTRGSPEIVLSGPGTFFTPFQPAGAFDYIAEEGIGGWLYDPASTVADEVSFLVIDGTVKVPLGKRSSRPDLPYDSGTEQLFGFFVSNEAIVRALRAAHVPAGNGSAKLTLVSSSRLIAEEVTPWLPSDPDAGENVAEPSDGDALATGPAQPIILHVDRMYRAGSYVAVLGWATNEDRSAVGQGLYFQLDDGEEIFVPELDDRPELARKGMAGGRASFGVVFAWPEDRDLPNRLAIRTKAGDANASATLTKAHFRTEQVLAGLAVLGRTLRGTSLDLAAAGRSREAELILNDLHRMSIPLDALEDGERFWGAAGQLKTGFQLGARDVFGFLRGQDPLQSFAAGQKATIAIASSDALVEAAELDLGPAGPGRLEIAETDRVSGWLVSGQGEDDYAELDVYVNGIRYLTDKADRSRSDLIQKRITTKGGGFRFEPSNPDPASRSVEIRVAQAFTDNYLAGADGRLALDSQDRPNLDRLYSVVNSVRPRRVCVIVPIYNAAEHLTLCLESLVRHTDSLGRILLIDDCSPDPRIGEILADYEDFTNISSVRNETNLGFTRTVNRGIAMAGEDDVVFLNSDTIVTPGWLQGLRLAAYSGPKVATATAVSNNSGAFSVPEINVDNAFPVGWDVDDFARLVRQSALASYPRVPTGNGFCMFVRRDCIEAIGILDEAAFPVGYGEENDFCMRALRAGYEHVCDDRTFVYHKRSASFGATRSEHNARGRETLRLRYPEYQRLTAIFDTGSDMLGMRWRVRKSVAEYRQSAGKPLPRVAFVISTKTGGTPQTNRDLMAALADRYEPWVLRCDSRQIEVYRFDSGREELVFTHRLRDRILPAIHRSSEYNEAMTKLLVRYGFEMVHIRHLAWHGVDLPAICQQLGLPVILSFHDFYTVCPTTKLLDENRTYCGGKCTSSGGDCAVELWEASLFPALKHNFVHRWREIFQEAFEQCGAFVTTSERAKDVLVRNFPQHLDRDFHVIPHGRSFAETTIACTFPEPSKPLRVLVPGNISPAKGADLIREIVALDTARTVEFHILGDAGHIEARDGIVLHGLYDRDEFGAIVGALRPSVGAVFSIWPETYCHTLTEMWSAGIPVVGIDIGAVGERIQEHGGGWLVPLGSSATDILALLRRIKQSRSDVRDKVNAIIDWQNGYGRTYNAEYMALKYDRLYRQVRKQHLSLLNPFAARDLKEIAVLTGRSFEGEAQAPFRQLTRNRIGSDRVYWHVGRDWSVLEGPVLVDQLVVVPDRLAKGDGQRIVDIAVQRKLPFHVLMGRTYAGSRNSLFGSGGDIGQEDRRLFSDAASVMVIESEHEAWARQFTDHVIAINGRQELPI